MLEKWKNFYEDYWISTFGMVYDNNKKEFIEPKTTKSGYQYVELDKKYYIHRLVAQNFIYNKNDYQYVAHIDGNKANNMVHNLEWTYKASLDVVRFTNSKLRTKLNKEQRDEVKKLYGQLTQKQLAEKFGVSISTISAILNDKYDYLTD